VIKQLVFKQKSSYSASQEELAAAQKELGLRFPPALIEFCSKWNGGFPKEENSFFPVSMAFHEFHTEYNSNTIGVTIDALLGLTDDLPQCSLLRYRQKLKNVSRIQLMPIGYDLLGNQVVLKCDRAEGLVYWRDHELWEAQDQPYLIPIAENLELFYNSLTKDPSADE
jgi:hypothetical protein